MAKRFVVYTVCVGNYDVIQQPIVIDKRFDYILFSDSSIGKKLGVWEVRKIDYESEKDFLKARYPRLQPEKVLPEYDGWLYLDGTLQITSQYVYNRCFELADNGIEWAANKHHCASNVSEEMSNVILDAYKEPHDVDCVGWYFFLKESGFLSSEQSVVHYETGCLFRLHTENVATVNTKWWENLVKFVVMRDQFVLPFALWSSPQLSETNFLPDNENVWHNSNHILYTRHAKSRILRKKTIWERIRYRCWRENHDRQEPYTHLFDEAYKLSTNSSIALNLWTIKAMIINCPIILLKTTNNMLKRAINHFRKICYKKVYLPLSPKAQIYERWNRMMDYPLNLDNPQTFCEKIQWLKLHDHNPIYHTLVDKYEVKKYVSNLIGEEHVVKLYAVYNNENEIDFEKLPNSFVLKCTHDSGGFAVCTDKTSFDKEEAIKKLRSARSVCDYSIDGYGWAYKKIKPRIIAEEYIDSLGKPDSIEYKITCINGKVKMITVCSGIAHSDYDKRFNDHFDREGNRLPFYVNYKPAGLNLPSKTILDELICYSEKLSKGIPQVRVDFYVHNGLILFGEMTFYTWGGTMNYVPKEWDSIMGSWLDLDLK